MSLEEGGDMSQHRENRGDGRQVIVPESGTTKRTHLTPLYHPDTLLNPETYIVYLTLKIASAAIMVDLTDFRGQ